MIQKKTNDKVAALAVEAIRSITNLMKRFDGFRMAQLLNESIKNPENAGKHIIGAQPLISPREFVRPGSQKVIDDKSFITAVSSSILVAWYYTRTVCCFDSDLSEELEKTEEADILVNKEQCSRFLGSPVLIPFDEPCQIDDEWDVLGVFLGAYTNSSRGIFLLCILPLMQSIDKMQLNIGVGMCKINVDDTKKLLSLREILTFAEGGKDVFLKRENSPLVGFDGYKSGLIKKIAYLFTETPDVKTCFSSPSPVPARRRRHPDFLFAPQRPRNMLLGQDFGEMIRQHRSTDSTQAKERTEHGTVRPHIRRAHWHTYLSGHGREVRTLKWQPPIFVRAADH